MKSSFLLYTTAVLVSLVGIWLGFPQPTLDMKNDILPLARERMSTTSSSSTTTPLQGMIVVVTGPTSGIGWSLTQALTSLGATVVALGRSPTKLQELVNHTLPGVVVPIVADLTDLQSVADAAHAIQEKFDHVDVLINNAGMHYKFSSFTNPTTPQGYDQSFGVNYLSHFLLTERMIPLLKKAHYPTIVQISSSFHWAVDGSELMASSNDDDDDSNNHAPIASQPRPFFIWRDQRAYANSKLAQLLHMRSLQRDHGDIRSVGVCPGWVGTQIGGTPGSLGHWILGQFAFPMQGWGVASSLHAVLETTPSVATKDYYTSSAIFDVFRTFPNMVWAPWSTRTPFRDVVAFVFASMMLFGQKFVPDAKATVSSPESYDVALQDSLYQWSQKAVAEFL